jgi:hypothetical protein
MIELSTGEDWYRLFHTFEHTARRLETRDAYASADEDAAFRRFLNGQAEDPRYGIELEDWTVDVVGAAVAAGKRFARVRVVRDPPTDYQRFGLRNARYNVAAGEDIRYLGRERATQLRLPGYDFWLFDESQLALMHFADDGAMLGVVIVTAPSVVRQHADWLDLAMAAATPYAAFVAADPTRALPPGSEA